MSVKTKINGEWVKQAGYVSMPTDTTLEVANMAADAQTVGEKLATKQAKGNYALKSEIPQIAAWAQSLTKPTYTAAEVGALPADTKFASVDDIAELVLRIDTLEQNLSKVMQSINIV